MNIVYQQESQVYSGKQNRIAEIDGRYWPHRLTVQAGQVEWGSTVAANTAAGIKYVSESFGSLASAKRALVSAGY